MLISNIDLNAGNFQVEDRANMSDKLFVRLSTSIAGGYAGAEVTVEEADNMIVALTYFRDRALKRRFERSESVTNPLLPF